MQQSFPGIKADELQLISPIPTALRPRLEEIAKLAVLQPLPVGEPREGTPQRRTTYINNYLIPPRMWDTCEWLIALDKTPIGYAAAWNGWQPVEQEQHDPCLEILFMDPRYSHLSDQARDKITSLLPALKED